MAQLLTARLTTKTIKLYFVTRDGGGSAYNPCSCVVQAEGPGVWASLNCVVSLLAAWATQNSSQTDVGEGVKFDLAKVLYERYGIDNDSEKWNRNSRVHLSRYGPHFCIYTSF